METIKFQELNVDELLNIEGGAYYPPILPPIKEILKSPF